MSDFMSNHFFISVTVRLRGDTAVTAVVISDLSSGLLIEILTPLNVVTLSSDSELRGVFVQLREVIRSDLEHSCKQISQEKCLESSLAEHSCMRPDDFYSLLCKLNK